MSNVRNMQQFRRERGLNPKKGKVGALHQLAADSRLAIESHRELNPSGNFPTVEELEASIAKQSRLGDAWFWDFCPKRSPEGWIYRERYLNGVVARRKDGLTVICTGAAHDGARWIHLSVSRPGKGLPTYYDLKAAKAVFVGDMLYGYQVFPPPSANVSYDEVLHIWACADKPCYLPNFTEGWDML